MADVLVRTESKSSLKKFSTEVFDFNQNCLNGFCVLLPGRWQCCRSSLSGGVKKYLACVTFRQLAWWQATQVVADVDSLHIGWVLFIFLLCCYLCCAMVETRIVFNSLWRGWEALNDRLQHKLARDERAEGSASMVSRTET